MSEQTPWEKAAENIVNLVHTIGAENYMGLEGDGPDEFTIKTETIIKQACLDYAAQAEKERDEALTDLVRMTEKRDSAKIQAGQIQNARDLAVIERDTLCARVEQMRLALETACVASCTCQTKTPDWWHHAVECRYRYFSKCLEDNPTPKSK